MTSPNSKDNERWDLLFSHFNELSSSHTVLREKVQTTNDMLKAIIDKQTDHEKRLFAIENKISRLFNYQRSKNIVLFKLEDCDSINTNLFQIISQLFKDIGINIPEVAIVDAFRLGKKKGNRPVLIKLIAER